MSDLPEMFGLQLQPDHKQHHHHAKFGKMLKLNGLTAYQTKNRTDQNASQNIAQHRAEPEARGECYSHQGSGQINHDLKKNIFHLSVSPLSR